MSKSHKLGERFIKMNALKILVGRSKSMEIKLIDHVKDGVLVVINKDNVDKSVVLMDSDRVTIDESEVFVKQLLEKL